jgi:hypothetical protein
MQDLEVNAARPDRLLASGCTSIGARQIAARDVHVSGLMFVVDGFS